MNARSERVPSSMMALAFAVLACSGEPDTVEVTAQTTQPIHNIDVRRSLVVTEQAILERFPLKRVMEQLVAQSNVPGLTAKKLFQQWWDIFNPAPGLGAGPHCNDQVDPTLGPVINGFPYTCR